jgi:predicted PurR-regulated permease PerM
LRGSNFARRCGYTAGAGAFITPETLNLHKVVMSSDKQDAPPSRSSNSLVVDNAIRLAFVGLLAAWSLMLVGPFVTVGIWGVVLAVALYPVFAWLRARFGGRATPAALLVTLVLLLVVIGPASLLSTGLVENVQDLAARFAAGTLRIPPPGASVRDWPLVGDQVFQLWSLASTNLAEALSRLEPQLKALGKIFLSAAAGAGIGVLQFLASAIIAGFLFAPAAHLVSGVRAFAERVVGPRGDLFVDLAGNTLRNVARGVIGISLLQSLLIGIGLLVAGVPGAGLITFLALILGIVQIGPGIVVLLAIVWAWTTQDTLVALLFTVYMIPVTLLDNVLKPIVMSRGLTTPMLVIFIGVIGGTLVHGLIGLFIGPIVLAVAYELLVVWVNGEPPKADDSTGPSEPAARA